MLLQCYWSWPGSCCTAGKSCAEAGAARAAPLGTSVPRALSEMGLETCDERGCKLTRAERSPVTNRGAALLAESPQTKGLVLGFAILMAVSLLPQRSSGEVGSIQILLITTHPHQALCYKIQISAVRIILTIPLPNSLSKCTPVPLRHHLLLASLIHKTHRFRIAPSCTNSLKMLEVRIYLEKAPVTQWR